MQSNSSRRGLSTARTTLQVAWLLAARPEGIRADDVAAELGKSVSTAYNLLVSLCDEGVAVHHSGGLYRLAPAFREMVATGAVVQQPEPRDMAGAVDDLLARCHKRSYLGLVRNGELRVMVERGHQGMPKLPRLGDRIAGDVHALALGKVVLAMAPPDAAEHYLRAGLRRFTSRTITDADRLRGELREVRRLGFAVEDGEFDDDFSGIAAPVLDGRGRFLAVIGISMTRRAFAQEHETLALTVVAVARSAGATVRAGHGARRHGASETPRFQPSTESPRFLDSPAVAGLAWTHGTRVP